MPSPISGWVGKILRVNLTTGATEVVETARYTHQYIGGRGMASRIYWEEVPPDCRAFDPENKLIFTTGPLTGTPAPSAGRTNMAFKSPKTYSIESYAHSHAGGHWGPELKYAGFDGLIVEGQAKQPVYIWIDNGRAEILDAKHLWGRDTFATQQELARTHGPRIRSFVIGIAGEKLHRNAVILTDTDSAFGDSGPGGVMGSKNLKAIAVRGEGRIGIARPRELLETSYELFRLITRKEGEPEPPHPWRRMGGWAGTKMEEEQQRGEAELGLAACFGCPVACRRTVKLRDQSMPAGALQCSAMQSYEELEKRYYGGKTWGRTTFRASQLANMYGIGSRELLWNEATREDRGGLNWVEDCYQNGVLTEENTGLALGKMGSQEFIEEYMRKLAYREGIGDILAEGIPRAAEYIRDHPDEFNLTPQKAAQAYALYEKATDPRMGGYFGRAGRFGGYTLHRWGASEYPLGLRIHSPVCQIFTAVDPRDAQTQHDYSIHMVAEGHSWMPPGSDVWRNTLENFAEKWFGSKQAFEASTYDYKPEIAIFAQHLNLEKENLILCDWIFPVTYSRYTSDYLGDRELTGPSKLFSAVTGINKSRDEMWAIAERCWNLERAISCREGRRRQDDWLLPGYFDLIDQQGHTIDREEFRRAMDRYYQLRGWDAETGVPTRIKLEELGLVDAADDLAAAGALPG